MRLCLIVVALYFLTSVAVAQDENAKKAETDAKPLMLTESRTYRLEVKELDPEVHVVVAKQWVFEKGIPTDLLAAIKKSHEVKNSENELFHDAQGKPEKDSGYIRWGPEKESRKGTGALLWFVNGKKRKELLVSIDMMLDHTLARGRSPQQYTFDSLKITVDLKSAKLIDVWWDAIRFPPQSKKSMGVQVADSVQVSVTGTLTEKTSQSIRSADRLLGEEISTQFNRLAQGDFRNESHHGITLGWLGQGQLRHQLMLLTGPQREHDAFLYSVSGPSFPLAVMHRQLQADAWPLVLHGTEYVGSTDSGVHIFRPVEYLLSQQPAKQTTK